MTFAGVAFGQAPFAGTSEAPVAWTEWLSNLSGADEATFSPPDSNSDFDSESTTDGGTIVYDDAITTGTNISLRHETDGLDALSQGATAQVVLEPYASATLYGRHSFYFDDLPTADTFLLGTSDAADESGVAIFSLFFDQSAGQVNLCDGETTPGTSIGAILADQWYVFTWAFEHAGGSLNLLGTLYTEAGQRVGTTSITTTVTNPVVKASYGLSASTVFASTGWTADHRIRVPSAYTLSTLVLPSVPSLPSLPVLN